jgi:hypothetical protein
MVTKPIFIPLLSRRGYRSEELFAETVAAKLDENDPSAHGAGLTRKSESPTLLALAGR